MSLLSFTKRERLKSKTIIGQLFKKGQSVRKYPIRIVWIYLPLSNSQNPSKQGFPTQVTFSVPKRHFKKAVNRNRIRRQMREAYRLNKATLYRKLHQKNTAIALMLIYTGKESASYARIETAIQHLFQHIRLKD